MRNRLCVVFAVGVMLGAGAAPGQAPGHATRLLASSPSSSTLGSAVVARTGDVVYLLGRNGNQMRFGRSTDGGRTWPNGLRVLPPTIGAYDLAADGQRVFVAWEADTGGARQVWISTDGGVSFPTQRMLPSGTYTPHLHVDGLDVALVQIGMPNGVLMVHSGNGGNTWSPVVDLTQGLPGANAADLNLHLFADGAELIAVWERRIPRIHVASSRSVDGGATWSPTRTWPTDAPLVAAVAEPGRWFVQAGSTLWQSTNNGVTWGPIAGHGFAFPVAMAMNGPRMLVVESTGLTAPLRVASSLDGGNSWSISPVALPGLAEVKASVVGDAMFVMVARRGVHQSDDGGVTWRMVEDQEMITWDVRSDGAIAVAFVGGSAAGDYAWVSEGHTRMADGTPGTGGVQPTLRGAGLAGIGRTFTLELERARGNTIAAFWIVIGNESAAVFVPTSGTSTVPGSGSATLPMTVPASAAFIGLRVLSRGVVFDPAAAVGYCWTEGRDSWIR